MRVRPRNSLRPRAVEEKTSPSTGPNGMAAGSTPSRSSRERRRRRRLPWADGKHDRAAAGRGAPLAPPYSHDLRLSREGRDRRADPGRLSKAEEEQWVATMVERVTRSERRRRPSDEELVRRARRCPGSTWTALAVPASVRWVDNQRSRWGSCTPADRTIRISGRVRAMPPYVVDYVLLHELTHLLVHGHGDEFWAWVDRYPLTERARGFLEGVSRHRPAGHRRPERRGRARGPQARLERTRGRSSVAGSSAALKSPF